MAKKKQTLGQQMYAKQIKRIKNYISKKEKQGYVFSDKESLIPQMPKRVTRQALDKVSDISAKELLAHSTKAVFNPIKQKSIIMSGTEAQKIESSKAYKKYLANPKLLEEKLGLGESIYDMAEETANNVGASIWNGEYYEGEGWIPDKVRELDAYRARIEQREKQREKQKELLNQTEEIRAEQDLLTPIEYSQEEIEARKDRDFSLDVSEMVNDINKWYDTRHEETPEERFYRYQQYNPSSEPIDFVDTVLAEVEEMIDTYDSYVDSNSNWGDFFKEEKLRYNSTLRNILNGAINLFGRKQIADNCQANAQRLIEIVNEILYGSGGGRDKDNYYNEMSSRIVEFAELLKGSALSLEENEIFTGYTQTDEGDEYNY